MNMVKRQNFENIENAFSTMRNGDRTEACITLKTELHKCFNKSFMVNIIPEKERKNIFIMSVIPDEPLLEKLSSCIIDGATKFETISELWKKCDLWHIEIDERIIKSDLTDKELTALLMHEIGHVINTDSIPNRLNNIMHVIIADQPIETKAIMKGKIFNKILQIPIINSCIYNNSKKEMSKELKADKFSVKAGYLEDIVSAMDKIERILGNSIKTKDKSLEDSTKYAINLIDMIKERKGYIVKKNLRDLKDKLPDTYIKKTISVIESTMFKHTYTNSNVVQESYNMDNIYKSANILIEDAYMKEFFDFRKKLKPIQQNELDYIDLQIENMKTVNDKLLLVSYINSKLDMIRYYMEILDDPKSSKKYIVPHNKATLIKFNNRLVESKNAIMKYKLPEKSHELVVYYPTGYEG